MESRYNDALPTRESLEAKAQAGMRLMEGFLSELETRALAVRDSGISEIIDGGWKIAEEGYGKAKGKAKEVVDEGLEKARRARETLKESIDIAITRAKEHRLINYEDLPHPWRVNPHITRGYRFSENKIDCIKSAFNFSNETVNIWSHAIGLVIVLSIAFYAYPSSVNFSQSSKTDVFFAAAFFFAACKCLVCSCMWHTMSSISEQTLMERFACVDYTGISLLIAASIMTTEYTAFYCEPVSRWIYIVTTATLGVAGVILPWHPTFNRADMNWCRVAFYVSLAATGFAPIFQLSWTRSAEWAWMFYAPIGKSIIVYFVGALIYAGQVKFHGNPTIRAIADFKQRSRSDGCMDGLIMLVAVTTSGIWQFWEVSSFTTTPCKASSRWPLKGANRSADWAFCRGRSRLQQEPAIDSSAE